MSRSVRLFSLMATAALSLTACQPGVPIFVKDPQLVAQPDKVSMMLAQAADKASNALESLAAVEQKRTPAARVEAITDAPPELRRAITINWVGPVEQIAKLLADRAGYRFVPLGRPPATPVVVSVDATNTPVIEVLRNVGLQLGARANVHVDSDAHVVELNFSPVTGLGDMADSMHPPRH